MNGKNGLFFSPCQLGEAALLTPILHGCYGRNCPFPRIPLRSLSEVLSASGLSLRFVTCVCTAPFPRTSVVKDVCVWGGAKHDVSLLREVR